MFAGILKWLGLAKPNEGTSVHTVKLNIQEEIRQFNESKDRIDHQLSDLEERTEKLDDDVALSLTLTRTNQHKLENIEEAMNKMIELSQEILAQKGSLPSAARPVTDQIANPTDEQSASQANAQSASPADQSPASKTPSSAISDDDKKEGQDISRT